MGILNYISGDTHFKRKFKQSGDLHTTNDTTISPNTKFIFNLDERYIPYDEAIIVNLDTDNDCSIFINGTEQNILPSGNRAKLDGYNIRQLAVLNNGSATIAINKIQVTYRYTGIRGEKIKNNASTILQGAFNLKGLLK